MPLPNPYEAQNAASPPDGTDGKRRRRDWPAIFAITRQLIVERHFIGVTVRFLAERCQISPQALHARFGTRDAMLAAAINDYTLALFRYGQDEIAARNPVLAFVEAMAQAHDAYPEMYGRMAPNIFFERTGAQIFERAHGFGIVLIHRALSDMRRQGRINHTADLRGAAAAVSAVMSVVLLAWGRGTIRRGELRREITSQVDLLFQGLEPR